jgi:crossover junction endodeoxyribonuclease RuvC
MIILGIDPGFDKVGYSIFDKKSSSNYTFIASGLIKTDKKDKHEIETTIKLHKVQVMVVEQLFFFKNAKSVIGVAQAQGVIQLLAAQYNLNFHYLTPLQIKQIITGYGNADKTSVHKMLGLLLKQEIKVKEDDESDAIACGLAFCCINEKLL